MANKLALFGAAGNSDSFSAVSKSSLDAPKWLHETMGIDAYEYQCGNGVRISGETAAKLGAKHCFLTDIDPVAVASAKHNAEKNGVEERIAVAESNLVDDTSMQADLILANITAEILVHLAPAIPSHLFEGGTVILSGILPDRMEKVQFAFAEAGLHPVKEMRRGEWAALVLRRK